MLPIGQLLWMKELESYKKFPPLQDAGSYNLDQDHRGNEGQSCESRGPIVELRRL